MLISLILLTFFCSFSNAGPKSKRFVTGDVWSKFNNIITRSEAQKACAELGGSLFALKEEDTKKPISEFIVEELLDFVRKVRESPTVPETLLLGAEKNPQGKFVWKMGDKDVPFEGYDINEEQCGKQERCCFITLVARDVPYFATIKCDPKLTQKFLCSSPPSFQEISNVVQQVNQTLETEIGERQVLTKKLNDMNVEPSLPGFGGVYTFFAFVLIPSLIVATVVYLVKRRSRYSLPSTRVRFESGASM